MMVISVHFKKQTALYIATPLTHTLFLQDLDDSLVTQVSLEEGCTEGGIILEEQLPGSEREMLPSSELEDHLPSFGLEDQLPGSNMEEQQPDSGPNQLPCSGDENLPSTS